MLVFLRIRYEGISLMFVKLCILMVNFKDCMVVGIVCLWRFLNSNFCLVVFVNIIMCF